MDIFFSKDFYAIFCKFLCVLALIMEAETENSWTLGHILFKASRQLRPTNTVQIQIQTVRIYDIFSFRLVSK